MRRHFRRREYWRKTDVQRTARSLHSLDNILGADALNRDPDRQTMTSAPLPIAESAEAASATALALAQSHEVRDKVQECADDLASKNEAVKQQIADGATTLPAHESLSESEAVEAKVEECANDLHQVTETLAQGVEDLKKVELALARSRHALATTESSLVAAKQDESRSRLRALHDTATGLPNRSLFDDRLSHAISLAERQQWTLAVMFLDLDHFKRINDTHGHAAGDVVLKEVAHRLLQHARDEDTVCRNGGDEFLYLLVNPQGAENVERIAQHTLTNMAVPIIIGALDLVVSPSIGIALFPDHATTAAELIARADAAMYRAKRQKCGYAFASSADAMGSGDGSAILSGTMNFRPSTVVTSRAPLHVDDGATTDSASRIESTLLSEPAAMDRPVLN